MQQKLFYPECDNLCLIGIQDKGVFEWLERDEKRRLFLVGCGWTGSHPRIWSYGGETMLHQKLAANEIGWSAAMQHLEIRAAEGWESLEFRVRESHLAAFLLLSSVKDMGIGAFSNARKNWKRGPFVSLASLKGKLAGIPAIVAGAGPSLEDALPTLKEASSRALLIGSGTALSIFGKWGIKPHLACALDQRTPTAFVKSAEGSLFCVQSQLNSEAMAEIAGRKILATEQGALWESWWLSKEGEFDSGCIVGTFATQIALYLGCSPILFTGMDLCYRGNVKYAEHHKQDRFELVETQNRKGASVLTQHDWLMALQWHRTLSSRHPERHWINTALDGLSFGDEVEVFSWKESMQFLKREVDAQERLRAAVEMAPELKVDEGKEAEWQESLKRLLAAPSLEAMESEPVYRYYLAPLWNLWRPVFQRKYRNEEDFEGARGAFFQKVLTLLNSVSSL